MQPDLASVTSGDFDSGPGACCEKQVERTEHGGEWRGVQTVHGCGKSSSDQSVRMRPVTVTGVPLTQVVVLGPGQ